MSEPKLSSVQSRMFQAKAARKLSFEQIGQELGVDEVYAAAIFYGQAKPTEDQIKKLTALLNIPTQHLVEEMGEHYFPSRGGLMSMPPEDPTLYRFVEMIKVYGYPLKAIIHEKFGDGIMSAIDFKAHVDKVEDPKGDRVKITLDGKFLPFNKGW
ncbi:lambda repressor-like HTH type 3 transcription factor [Mucor lusitanicus]|uniref:Cyanate hydratase n=2 Tax=Mucor circinelloides f. lusitanicus TaxID=29924 RepID=A0A8H4F459_MUCCL|nr:lambda repressor-like HTH type 3 transcription factor [Mucor lusitanicus]